MEEKLRVLKMVEEGKISAEEAAELLASLNGQESEERSVRQVKGGVRGRKLRIVVTSLDSEKPKVNVKIPLRLVKWAERFIPSDARKEMDNQGINLDEILSSVDELEQETLVDVTDDESGEHVRIFIE